MQDTKPWERSFLVMDRHVMSEGLTGGKCTDDRLLTSSSFFKEGWQDFLLLYIFKMLCCDKNSHVFQLWGISLCLFLSLCVRCSFFVLLQQSQSMKPLVVCWSRKLQILIYFYFIAPKVSMKMCNLYLSCIFFPAWRIHTILLWVSTF